MQRKGSFFVAGKHQQKSPVARERSLQQDLFLASEYVYKLEVIRPYWNIPNFVFFNVQFEISKSNFQPSISTRIILIGNHSRTFASCHTMRIIA